MQTRNGLREYSVYRCVQMHAWLSVAQVAADRIKARPKDASSLNA